MKLYFLISFCLLLIGCGGGGSTPMSYHRVASSTSALWITKGAISPTIGGETTPIVWNGQLLYVRTGVDTAGRYTSVYRQSDGVLLSISHSGLGFISAIVNNGTLYVFGTNSDSSAVMNGGNTVSMISTTDLITWTAPIVVFKSPYPAGIGFGIYNTTVSVDATGFVMAYEICEAGQVCFNARFLHSTDLVKWATVQGNYEQGIYTACPTIRYVNGFYYLFFISNYPIATDIHGYYAVNVSRSTDLINWQFSSQTVLSPLDGGDAANAATDMDLVEFNGQVRMVYMNVSQQGVYVPNSGLREATFNGTLAQFVAMFFI